MIKGKHEDKNLRKLLGKVSNGFDYWFTFVSQPGVEPTNNRDERAIREHVVQRKIIGTLRNAKGTSILDSLQMLRIKLIRISPKELVNLIQ